jgi:hypothetical protein
MAWRVPPACSAGVGRVKRLSLEQCDEKALELVAMLGEQIHHGPVG